MKEVMPGVETEPVFLPYAGEDYSGRTANRAKEARVDTRAQGTGRGSKMGFFDVQVSHRKASLLSRSEVSKVSQQVSLQ